jgi:hypothetical protein
MKDFPGDCYSCSREKCLAINLISTSHLLQITTTVLQYGCHPVIYLFFSRWIRNVQCVQLQLKATILVPSLAKDVRYSMVCRVKELGWLKRICFDNFHAIDLHEEEYSVLGTSNFSLPRVWAVTWRLQTWRRDSRATFSLGWWGEGNNVVNELNLLDLEIS